jgi:hypothetical protein
LIQKKDIWQNIGFWERVISQFIQFDIIKNKEEEEHIKQVEKERFDQMRAESAKPVVDEVEFTHNQGVDAFNVSEENLQKMTSVVHLKLTQIQHDMLSFEIPKRDIKQVMKKFLKQSKIIPNLMARDIMMRMQIEEQS